MEDSEIERIVGNEAEWRKHLLKEQYHQRKDIDGIKKKMNNFISMISYYGKVSLSLFLLHFIFLSLFFRSLDIFGWAILLFSYLGFWGFIMYIWNEFYNGVGSPEWLMVQVGRIGQKTGKTVKKEILIIEKEVKETVHKLKHERDKGSEG